MFCQVESQDIETDFFKFIILNTMRNKLELPLCQSNKTTVTSKGYHSEKSKRNGKANGGYFAPNIVLLDYVGCENFSFRENEISFYHNFETRGWTYSPIIH